jgi:hypothetical protein
MAAALYMGLAGTHQWLPRTCTALQLRCSCSGGNKVQRYFAHQLLQQLWYQVHRCRPGPPTDLHAFCDRPPASPVVEYPGEEVAG